MCSRGRAGFLERMTARGHGGQPRWPEYCLSIMAWFSPSLRRHLPLVWSHITPARPGQGLFLYSTLIPPAPLPRASSCCTIPTPAIHYMPGRDIVEVLTKCRAENLLRRKNPFGAAGVRTKRMIGSAKAR
jgi:hypothetical protein